MKNHSEIKCYSCPFKIRGAMGNKCSLSKKAIESDKSTCKVPKKRAVWLLFRRRDNE